MQRFVIVFWMVFAAGSSLALGAENWPQWRGPLGTGIAADGDYPVKFSADEGVAWRVALPGRGSSTPAVWGDQIFVTCGIDGNDGVVCYGMDGKEQWRKAFGKERPGKHASGTGSNPSPVTDGKHIVVYYKSGTLACLRPNGRLLWETNLQKRYGKDTLWWDLGTSPVLAGDRVVVAVMQSGESYLVAFNLENGDEVWKTDRTYKTSEESDNSYASPQVVQSDGKDVVVTWGADRLTGHDAADGKLIWECAGFNPTNEVNWRSIASATVDDGIAIVPYGRGSFLAGVRADGRGDVTKTNRIWENDEPNSDVPTPVVKDGKAILLGDRGQLVCRDTKTGDEVWSSELPRNRNKYYASPVLAGDLLYCAREDGAVFVGRVTDQGFELLTPDSNAMNDHLIATPVPIRNGLLVRGDEFLYRIEANRAAPANTGG